MVEQSSHSDIPQSQWPQRIVYGEPGGFCAGLVRSVEAYRNFTDTPDEVVYSVGEPAHNPYVIAEFKDKGMIFVKHISEVPKGSKAAIQPHGDTSDDLRIAEENGITYIRTECPLVTKVKNEIVRNTNDGLTTIYYGQIDKKGNLHAETRAALSSGSAILITSLEQIFSEEVLAQIPDVTKLAFAWQTTHNADEVLEIKEKLELEFPGIRLPKTDDTCFATRDRQKAAKEVIESGIGTIIVVGDLETSSNTKSLASVAESKGARVFVVNDQVELDPDNFLGLESVGIVASASAPKVQIDGVKDFFVRRGSELSVMRVADESKIVFTAPTAVTPNKN
jgi:4-hydroxy-3-methylbut-2-en-1-yl diphosphate reductase